MDGRSYIPLFIHICGQGTQAERLVDAVVSSIIHISPESDLPEDMQREFQEFMSEITATPAQGNEGTVQATVDTLDEVGLSSAIEKIISFYDAVCRHKEPF